MFVYGDHVLVRREQVWERFTQFSTTRTRPWFMIGDFNEITCHNEKKRGNNILTTRFYLFLLMQGDCGILEDHHLPCPHISRDNLICPSLIASVSSSLIKLECLIYPFVFSKLLFSNKKS